MRRAGARRSIRGVVMLVVRRRGGDAPGGDAPRNSSNVQDTILTLITRTDHYTINPLTTITRLIH